MTFDQLLSNIKCETVRTLMHKIM